MALVTFPLMAGVQEICDRTALATGKGLGELIVARFGRAWRAAIGLLIGALIVANVLNIAADLVAVGAGMHLLHAGPIALWAVLAGVIIMVLLVSGSFATIARVFKVLCVALLAYVGVLFFVKIPWGAVIFNTVVPHIRFSREYVALLVGVLGTTISPYLFFWQSMHRIEDMREEDAGGTRPLPLRRRSRVDAAGKQSRSRFDVFTGMAFSNVVMFAIIVATAITLTPKSG
ncbi:MAG: divalent metal cation transporter, partial [Acidimicrobiales bacterium]